MKQIEYRKIDAFTSGKSLGNPAACFYLGNESLSAEIMQQVAAEHKGFVSEVVFCEKAAGVDCKLTYYSSECEVDFCGHGTIATMYDFVKHTPLLRNKKEILFETNKKGKLKLYNELDSEDAVYITAPKPIDLQVPVHVTEIADALECGDAVISKEYPIDFIDAGLRTLLVPIISLEKEIIMYPNEAKLKEFCLSKGIDIILVFSKEVSQCGFMAHTRVFAPKFGYLEDPATGSGNSAFANYLLKNSLWTGESISVEQGGNNRLFNTVKLCCKDGDILFGGSSTTKIIGKYLI